MEKDVPRLRIRRDAQIEIFDRHAEVLMLRFRYSTVTCLALKRQEITVGIREERHHSLR